jgi:hypothetical protein
MTSKIYKSAQGKTVDLGTIILQNEHVRAVGNMNVNARGDKLGSNNQVLETKPRQIQKQNARTTNVSREQVQTSSLKARRQNQTTGASLADQYTETLPEEPLPVTRIEPPVQDEIASGKIPAGGLAAAIARSREVKQELEKTSRQRAQEQPLRKI